MILVIGGANQGKTAFARKLAGLEPDQKMMEADGRMSDFCSVQTAQIILRFHDYIKRLVQAGQAAEPFVSQVLAADPQIIVMDEVGYGIVPAAAWERQYREAVGLAGQQLAVQAEAVYRIVCGIETRIKG